MLDPVAVNVMKYYPASNTTGNAVTNLQNYYKTGARALDIDQFDVRVDHNFSSKDRTFFRWGENSRCPSPSPRRGRRTWCRARR